MASLRGNSLPSRLVIDPPKVAKKRTEYLSKKTSQLAQNMCILSKYRDDISKKFPEERERL